MPSPSVTVRLLGEPAINVAGEERSVTRPREQAVLVRLALAAPAPVPIGVLVDDVWGASPPASVVDSLRVHVSHLRKALSGAVDDPAEVLVTSRGAYHLDLDRQAVDVHRLEDAVRERRDRVLRTLLNPWPGHDLGRFDTGSGFFAATAQRITELRAAGAEVVAEVDLASGQHERAVGGLEALVRLDPYRERGWELLIRSLEASGRRTDALRAGQRAREALGEVGMDPGPALVAAEEAVFDHGAGAAGLPVGPSEYVDVGGSRIAFRTLGSHGPDLLFMHGGFVPFEVMPDEPRFARFLERLARRHRVILLDRRGIGMSDPPADDGPVTLDHWVDDCRAVLDALASERCFVLAHENAGPVAIRLAAEDPERVRGLVLHSTVAKYLRAPDHPYGPTEDAFARIDRMIDRVPGAADMLTLVAPSVGDDPDLRAWLDRAGRLGAGPARARQLHRVYFEADVRPYLRDVAAPTAVLHPARLVRSDPGQARYLADHLPDAELQMLDSGDHLPFLADAEVLLDALQRVVERAERPPEEAPKVLRALLGVAPAAALELVRAHDPERCLELEGAVVAVFRSRSEAEQCASALADRRPGFATVLEVDDTAATVDDLAVVAVADAARRAGPDGEFLS